MFAAKTRTGEIDLPIPLALYFQAMGIPRQSPDAGQADDAALAAIEADALRMVRRAGHTLMRSFGAPLEVQYKDQRENDPVTNLDREVQADIVRAISESYPGHGIVGEEDEEDVDGAAPDYVWVLDPLDGTKNFINGLPVFASSIGVLHRGVPVAGAVYAPWPGSADGLVFHGRKGGGAYANGERAGVFDGVEPKGNRLMTLPESFPRAFRFDARMKGSAGELRVSGSTVYELAMTARGVLQYSFHGAPHLWDIAAGAVLVTEAGGAVMVADRRQSRVPFAPHRLQWSELRSFFPRWGDEITLAHMRRWRSPILCGSPQIAAHVASSMKSRRR